MKASFFLILSIYLILFTSCKFNATDVAQKEVSKTDQIKNNIDSLKRTATTGDLILRLGDDLLSYQISLLNKSDKTYSHAGLVVEKGMQKYVAHIAPEVAGADTIQYIPIDSFINTTKNVTCALYRYALSASEKDSIKALLQKYKRADTRFDRLYDLATEKEMYCSEMISKALKRATDNRIVCKQVTVPPRMQKVLVHYFKKERLTPEIIAQRKIVTLDALYLMPQCSLVMQFSLKYFP